MHLSAKQKENYCFKRLTVFFNENKGVLMSSGSLACLHHKQHPLFCNGGQE